MYCLSKCGLDCMAAFGPLLIWAVCLGGNCQELRNISVDHWPQQESYHWLKWLCLGLRSRTCNVGFSFNVVFSDLAILLWLACTLLRWAQGGKKKKSLNIHLLDQCVEFLRSHTTSFRDGEMARSSCSLLTATKKRTNLAEMWRSGSCAWVRLRLLYITLTAGNLMCNLKMRLEFKFLLPGPIGGEAIHPGAEGASVSKCC